MHYCSATLRGAELDVETVKSHAEQFRIISETSEQALADLQRRYDEYEASTSAEITRLQVGYPSCRQELIWSLTTSTGRIHGPARPDPSFGRRVARFCGW